MDFIKNLFKTDKIDCPRCLGKGHVDLEDIKRLNMELKWIPGDCAYCRGDGWVSQKMTSIVKPDNSYLTIELPTEERSKLVHNNLEAKNRAANYDEELELIIKEIEFMYSEEKMSPEKIADFFLISSDKKNYNNKKKNWINYIEKVISKIS